MTIMGSSKGSLRRELGLGPQAFDIVYRIFLTLLTWVVIAYAYIPFGFIQPRAARFSDTKALRYFQSCCFVALLFGVSVSLILLIAPHMLATGYSDIENRSRTSGFENAKRETIQNINARILGNGSNSRFTGRGALGLGADRGSWNWHDEIGNPAFRPDSDCRLFSPDSFSDASAQRLSLSNPHAQDCFLQHFVFEANQQLQRDGLLRERVTRITALEQAERDLREDYLPGVFIGAIVGTFILLAVIDGLVKTGLFGGFIRFLDQSRFGYGGAGRFTGLFEEMRNTVERNDGSIYLGRSLFVPFIKCGIKDDRHMLTIAGSRGGKGVSAIIPNLLLWRGSAIVIDPKGTNTAVTAKFRQEKLGQTVHVIDPFNITSRESIAFNPLKQFSVDAPDARERILLIADALVMSDGKERDPHWNDTARQVLAGYVAHLMTDQSYADRCNLPELRNMLRLSGEARSQLLADMCVNDAAGELAMDVANRIINMGDSAELKSILSSVEKHTEWLSSPSVAKSLSAQDSFKFSDAKDRKTTIYLVIPPQYLKTHARFIRLFINLTIRGFVDGGKAEIPTLLMMDEFLSLGHMAEVENAMSWTAGYNLFLWPFIQDFGSFKELYGTKVNAFLGNSRAVQVFAVDDEETNKFVSERIGKRPLTNRIEISRSNETLHLREPSEVALDISAESGRQYILQSGKPTMLLERTPYFKTLMFENYDLDPDHPKRLEVWQKMW